MDRRIRILLLKPLVVCVAALAAHGCSWFAGAEDPAITDARGPVLDPRVERRRIRTATIDTENVEAGLFSGFMSVEDFGTEAVFGARAAYHITESFFAEAVVGQTELGETSFEALSGAAPLLPDDDRDLRYYDLSVGWNVLPGEVFVGNRFALDSALYLVAGAGNTEFAGENHFTASFGAGYRVLMVDWMSAHLMVRDRLFTTDLLGEDKTAHNIEFSLGLSVYF